MAVLKNKDGTELFIDCNCGCDNGIRFRIDNNDFDLYCFMSYTNGKFYTEQCEGMRRVFRKKLKKIWSIIRNRDFYYAEMFLTKDEFAEFREYINSIG